VAAGTSPLLAVFVDADNIPAKHAGAIFREISSFGNPGLRRVYGDWSSPGLRGWKDEARALGLVAHQQTANTTGKNASDIGLVIDAMDVLHSGRFDGFVLVSSDSDFTRLAARIREQGLDVIGIGEKKAPASFLAVCTRFILIENFVEPTEAFASPKAASDKTPAQAAEKENPSKAIPLVRAAMRKIDPDGEWYTLGQLGQFIQKDHPDFDPRTYGSAKLSDLLRKTRAFEVKSGSGNALQVRDLA
jgi:NYN domain/OST-HTH/LOTUS domain